MAECKPVEIAGKLYKLMHVAYCNLRNLRVFSLRVERFTVRLILARECNVVTQAMAQEAQSSTKTKGQNILLDLVY